MTTSRAFHLGDILSITTGGVLVSPRGMVAIYGETREVEPLAAEDHTRIDPLTEMRTICQPPPGTLSVGDWDDEPCQHDCDEECDDDGCTHQHCMNCGGCGCPGYCDDTATYNLRPAETGGES